MMGISNKKTGYGGSYPTQTEKNSTWHFVRQWCLKAAAHDQKGTDSGSGARTFRESKSYGNSRNQSGVFGISPKLGLSG